MERRRTDRRKQLEMVLASLWMLCQKAERKLNETYQNGSGQRSTRAMCRNAGTGRGTSTHGDTGVSALTGYRDTPTASHGSLPSEISPMGSPYSTDATTLSASIHSTYSSEPNSTICATGTPKDATKKKLSDAQCPRTGRWNTQNWNADSTSCANPLETLPLFVTRDILSQHDLFFSLLYAAVTRKARGVLRYLERAESRESDVWAQQDYRVAQVVLILADEGAGNPYSKAFRQLFGKNAHEVRFWWRDREKLFAVSQIANSPTPLCHPDVGQSLPNELIPDYDYSRRSK